MLERCLSSIRSRAEAVADGLIDTKKCGEPFFGMLTIWGPVIDLLAANRVGKKAAETLTPEEDQPTKYQIDPFLK